MITKGIITSIDLNGNTCEVRMPLFETAGNDQISGTAIISNTPGSYNGYKVGDVVTVGFEDGFMSKPVVLGKLYLGVAEEKKDPRGVINVESLTSDKVAALPADTKLTAAIDSNVPNTTVPYSSLASVANGLNTLNTNFGQMDRFINNQFKSIIDDWDGNTSIIEQLSNRINMKVSETSPTGTSGIGWNLTPEKWVVNAYDSSWPDDKLPILTVDETGVKIMGGLQLQDYPVHKNTLYAQIKVVEPDPNDPDKHDVNVYIDTATGEKYAIPPEHDTYDKIIHNFPDETKPAPKLNYFTWQVDFTTTYRLDETQNPPQLIPDLWESAIVGLVADGDTGMPQWHRKGGGSHADIGVVTMLANNAIAVAQGKNSNYYSIQEPCRDPDVADNNYFYASNLKIGDCWFKLTGKNNELEGTPNKGELKQCVGWVAESDYKYARWEDIGSDIVANKITANYVNALNIIAKKITVLDKGDNNKILFEADGINGDGSVSIANFTVKNDKLYSNSHSSIDSTTEGIYIGNDGISIGNGFKVGKTGNVEIPAYTKTIDKKYCKVDYDNETAAEEHYNWWNLWESTETITTEWSKTIPDREDDKYIWEWTKIINGAGIPSDFRVCITGAAGSGGETGRSVLSVTKYYKLSTTEPNPPTTKNPTDWFTSPPAWESGKDYYESDRTIYDKVVDGKDFSWSAVVKNSLLTVNFINSLGITAEALKVTTQGGDTLFSANIANETENAVKIGGFDVNKTSISNGMTSFDDTTNNGVYIGTDGIALGKGAFKVSSDGILSISGYATDDDLEAVEDEIPTKTSELTNDSGFNDDNGVETVITNTSVTANNLKVKFANITDALVVKDSSDTEIFRADAANKVVKIGDLDVTSAGLFYASGEDIKFSIDPTKGVPEDPTSLDTALFANSLKTNYFVSPFNETTSSTGNYKYGHYIVMDDTGINFSYKRTKVSDGTVRYSTFAHFPYSILEDHAVLCNDYGHNTGRFPYNNTYGHYAIVAWRAIWVGGGETWSKDICGTGRTTTVSTVVVSYDQIANSESVGSRTGNVSFHVTAGSNGKQTLTLYNWMDCSVNCSIVAVIEIS